MPGEGQWPLRAGAIGRGKIPMLLPLGPSGERWRPLAPVRISELERPAQAQAFVLYGRVDKAVGDGVRGW